MTDPPAEVPVHAKVGSSVTSVRMEFETMQFASALWRISPGQNVPAESYSDTLTATITW